jgi:hypothetical protein
MLNPPYLKPPGCEEIEAQKRSQSSTNNLVASVQAGSGQFLRNNKHVVLKSVLGWEVIYGRFHDRWWSDEKLIDHAERLGYPTWEDSHAS